MDYDMELGEDEFDDNWDYFLEMLEA